MEAKDINLSIYSHFKFSGHTYTDCVLLLVIYLGKHDDSVIIAHLIMLH